MKHLPFGRTDSTHALSSALMMKMKIWTETELSQSTLLTFSSSVAHLLMLSKDKLLSQRRTYEWRRKMNQLLSKRSLTLRTWTDLKNLIRKRKRTWFLRWKASLRKNLLSKNKLKRKWISFLKGTLPSLLLEESKMRKKVLPLTSPQMLRTRQNQRNED